MKLYYAPAACSLSPHIVLLESGLPFETVRVSTKSHKTADGGDFHAINDKGYVPVLELDDGERLTEGPAIVQWIADQVPDQHLAPPNGTLARARLQEWLNFITSELHKGFGPLFYPAYDAAAKAVAAESLKKRLSWTDARLAGREFLLDSGFSVADAYLFTVLGWGHYVGLNLADWPNLAAYHARIAARPAVQAALTAEGLMK
ncbi:MAG: glutathione transferase GstA [Inhella sp.]